MQQASYLEGGPLMWILPLYLHINKKSHYDYDDADELSLAYSTPQFMIRLCQPYGENAYINDLIMINTPLSGIL